MIDNTDNTAVAAPVTEPKRKRTRGPLNQGHLRKLTKAETIGQAAQNNGHAAALAEWDITAPFVTEFLDDTEEARTKAADAVVADDYQQNRGRRPARHHGGEEDEAQDVAPGVDRRERDED
jgi:hypothetical protein